MTMELKPLYRAHYGYALFDGTALPDGGNEGTYYGVINNGRCEGRISGRYEGTNTPHRRADGTYEIGFRGFIKTDDGATIITEIGGYGRTHPVPRRQIIGWARHFSSDPRYTWLNDSVCAMEGEVLDDGFVIELHEMVWQQPAESV